MNRMLSSAELQELSVPRLTEMTKRDKLLRWAKLVRECDTCLHLYSNLENAMQPWLSQSRTNGTGTAFDLAQADPIFQDAGLPKDASIMNHMMFFELTQSQLHEFSCDCGGEISNKVMADRIESLAA